MRNKVSELKENGGANNRHNCLEVVSLGKSETDSLIQQHVLRFFAKIQKVDFESK